jgi:hypothetical protein
VRASALRQARLHPPQTRWRGWSLAPPACRAAEEKERRLATEDPAPGAGGARHGQLTPQPARGGREKEGETVAGFRQERGEMLHYILTLKNGIYVRKAQKTGQLAQLQHRTDDAHEVSTASSTSFLLSNKSKVSNQSISTTKNSTLKLAGCNILRTHLSYRTQNRPWAEEEGGRGDD